jgi:hypothetical protein
MNAGVLTLTFLSVNLDFFFMLIFLLANYKFNPNKPGIFQWQSVDDVFLMVVD